MEYVWYAVSGVLGGVLGGMGMGGGTLLIPLLTIFNGVGQHSAQAVNLIAFIPMAVVAILIHLKNKIINFKNVVFVILPGIVTCIIGCFVAKNVTGNLLGKIFGGFLIILAIIQFCGIFGKKE
jgi:uncharacterized membrane protein YfcA